ncbi:MAG: potassium channel family protein [Clostridiales bacterium]|nr:potassium channel family protein [Clostridiales bacterium]MCF8023708.1 potassium channel family protein [Clostridiales bacterium]
MTSKKRTMIIATITLLFIILSGSILFMIIEDFSFLDAVWLTVITITTVGFGDIVPNSASGRFVALFVVISGLWLFSYILSNFFSNLVEGRLIDLWEKRKMINKIKTLKNHIIICGTGRVGYEAIMELKNYDTPFIAIEKDEQRLKNLQDAEVLYIEEMPLKIKF